MRVYYDFHIHSALSPCADGDMTPNNIVNMSIIKGLDAIAVTDHNSCGNVRAVIEAAGDNILVIPGMEIETSEEVHMVALFPDIESAEKMEQILKESAPPIKNRPEIFGNQSYMDKDDNVIGEEERLLVTACGLDIFEVAEKVKGLGGITYPAHIDRESYSVVSNLGFLPPDLPVGSVEITRKSREELSPQYAEFNIITSSDAHYLGDISEKEYHIDILTKNTVEILAKLENKIK